MNIFFPLRALNLEKLFLMKGRCTSTSSWNICTRCLQSFHEWYKFFSFFWVKGWGASSSRLAVSRVFNHEPSKPEVADNRPEQIQKEAGDQSLGLPGVLAAWKTKQGDLLGSSRDKDSSLCNWTMSASDLFKKIASGSPSVEHNYPTFDLCCCILCYLNYSFNLDYSN